MNTSMHDRVTQAIIDGILDAGGTIDVRMQPVANAAIAAMQEPTERMLEEGGRYVDSPLLYTAFRAMIDAALEDPL